MQGHSILFNSAVELHTFLQVMMAQQLSGMIYV